MVAPKCIRLDPEANRKFNRDKGRVYGPKWRAENPRKYLVNTAKHRAIRKGREFSITEDDLEWPVVCPVLGIPLQYKGKGRCRASASIDRIDNSVGYVPGNVRVISLGANSAKGARPA